jgi:DNA adenine methylase
MPSVPQPIPYQGSKRQLAPIILSYLPLKTGVFYEPFAGSAAISLAMASQHRAQRLVLSDSLPALVQIWSQILHIPTALADAYTGIWEASSSDPRAHYDSIRTEFNQDHAPAKLLYLITRCVKNAVRFNQQGQFNQSPDKRRLGMSPARMRARIQQAHTLLSGKAEAECCDYAEILHQATPADLVYMDPPYMGVSGKGDVRYYQGLDLGRFIDELDLAQSRKLAFAISFDGRLGTRSYGPGLPESLGLTRIELKAGRSSQATLHGRAEETVESLYLSKALTRL